MFTTSPNISVIYSFRSVTGSGYFCSDPYPKYHNVDMQFCKIDPLATDSCDYVDLIKNPEQFTGYSGAAAHQVSSWTKFEKKTGQVDFTFIMVC